MRLHMFPSLTEEVLALGRDPDLPELTSYWVGDAAFSLVMHWHLPPDDTDFAGFAAGATSRVRERMEHLRSKLPEGWTIERVRGVTGDEHAELRPLLGAVHLPDTDATMKPRTIISVRGRFLLCSDGLSGMVPDGELLAIAGAGSPSAAAWNLIDRANRSGLVGRYMNTTSSRFVNTQT